MNHVHEWEPVTVQSPHSSFQIQDKHVKLPQSIVCHLQYVYNSMISLNVKIVIKFSFIYLMNSNILCCVILTVRLFN